MLISGEFKKEDVARALLYTTCNVAVTTAFDACLITKTKHIFIGGGFAGHPLAAKIIMQEFEFKRWYAANFMEGMVRKTKQNIVKCSGGSRMSPRWERQLSGRLGGLGAPTYDFVKYSQRLHEIKRILTPGGFTRASLDPPLKWVTAFLGSRVLSQPY